MKNGDRLGRGLGSLLPSSLDLDEEEKDVGTGDYFQCPITSISPNPYQPRREMDDQALRELAESIEQRGVLQPLVVRKLDGEDDRYELIAGERRLRASKHAGLAEVPVLVRNATAEDRLELALIENIQRQNLNPVEEAIAFKRLVDEFSFTQEEVARKVGKERSTVANTMRLLQLPDIVKEDIANKKLSMGHARVLLAVSDEEQLKEIREVIISQGLSVRQTEQIVSKWKNKKGAKKTPVQKKKIIPDSYCRTLSTDVSRVLGTKSKIVQNGSRGRLEIEYYSLDDLERIHKLLTSLKDGDD